MRPQSFHITRQPYTVFALHTCWPGVEGEGGRKVVLEVKHFLCSAFMLRMCSVKFLVVMGEYLYSLPMKAVQTSKVSIFSDHLNLYLLYDIYM